MTNAVKRKICIVTGARSEYGLLSSLMKLIQADNIFELSIVACGMHLSPRFGLTVKEIEADGFTLDAKIENLLSSDSALGTCKSIGLGILGFSDVFSRLAPDLVLVLGDRFEILAAVQSAYVMGIPVAHLHGGEVTEGLIDEGIRHAITKMSWWHFVATDQFRRRVIQLGESPERVFCVGALGIDNVHRIEKMSREALEKELDFELVSPCVVITHHPVTLLPGQAEVELQALLAVLERQKEIRVIITYPNADAEGERLIRIINSFRDSNPERVRVVQSLGVRRYLSLLRYIDVVIGNSSSGLIEVPSFGKPTINIGRRQGGRFCANSVLHCEGVIKDIEQTLRRALSREFRDSCSSVQNPYGDGRSAERIMHVLHSECWPISTAKRFHDIDQLHSI